MGIVVVINFWNQNSKEEGKRNTEVEVNFEKQKKMIEIAA